MSKKVKLKEVANLITKGTTPTSIGSQFTTSGINFIKSESICDSKFLNNSVFGYIDEETDRKLKRSRLAKDDLLFSIAGAYLGKIGIVRDKDLPANTNQAVGIVRLNKTLVNMDYIFYYFSQENINKYINKLSSQSSQPNLNLELLGKLEFELKDITTQQKIAAVLSALDSKIEINNRINTELETMAKTLYDYWFVHNDKVCKWKIVQLGDFITVNERSIIKGYSQNEIEYIDIASVSVGRLESTQKYELTNAPSRARRLVKHGDTIWSTVRPNRKSYLFISNPKENLVVSTGFAVLTPKTIPPSFLYFLSTTDKFVNFLVSNAEGSAYPAVSADRFAEIEFSMPPEKELAEFEKIVSPMLAKIAQNELENQTLANLRDWLLPMLMNGQVKVI